MLKDLAKSKFGLIQSMSLRILFLPSFLSLPRLIQGFGLGDSSSLGLFFLWKGIQTPSEIHSFMSRVSTWQLALATSGAMALLGLPEITSLFSHSR